MHPDRRYYVYILASRRNGTLYTGVIGDLAHRLYEHKTNLVDGFTKRYGVHILVWFEVFEDTNAAIQRENRIKKWRRAWKLQLIEQDNRAWRDLYEKAVA